MLRGSVKPLICALVAFILLGTLSATETFADDNEFEFAGTITSLPNTAGFVGDWVVGGRTVHVNTSTLIDSEEGNPAVGRRVEVEGVLHPDGSVTATEIEVDDDADDLDDFQFRGRVETLPGTTNFVGDWVVAGRTVHVTPDTFIQTKPGGPVAVGVPVKVIGTVLPDGSILARKVQTEKKDHVNFFEFEGTVQSLPSTPGLIGDWVIEGRTVHVTAATRLDTEDCPFAAGSEVEVKGVVRTDGSIDAVKIECEDGDDDFEFTGIVTTLPNTPGFVGDWVVDGRTVHVTSATEIDTEDGLLSVGALVKVEGTRRADGSVDAEEIEVERSATDVRPVPTFELHGFVESLPSNANLVGDWVVSGRTVHVTGATLVRPSAGAVTVGTFVRVRGTLRADNTVDALTVSVERGDGNGQLTPHFVLYGLVELLPSTPGFTGDWVVSGRTVHVASSTQVLRQNRPLAVDSFVKVVGVLRPDGSIDAVKIQVRRGDSTDRRVNFFEMFGTVEALPASGLVGDWRVSGLVVHTTSATQVATDEGPPTVGSRVKVTGRLRDDGTLDAERIVVQGDVDDSGDFVTTHYDDFLNRAPDDSGFRFWREEIEQCGSDARCREVKRINVSAAFFLSIEFQRTGYLVYKLYLASFGRVPTLAEFLADMKTIGEGVVVGEPQWQQRLAANRAAFLADWASHPAFASLYEGRTNAQYVDALYANAGLTLASAERERLISGLDAGTLTRSQVLLDLVENEQFSQREFNRAFVVMQYFGYLRRDPDPSGLQFWLSKLNQFKGNYIQAEMVKAFISSIEYRQRFGK
jgi:hypothetical protein